MSKELSLEIFELLDEFETQLNAYGTVPFTGKIMVNRASFLSIIEQIRTILPDEFKHVKRLYEETEDIKTKTQFMSNEIIDHAKAEAKQIMEEAAMYEKEKVNAAEHKAKQLVDENEIVRRAKHKAKDMVMKAESDANNLKTNALDYVSNLLSSASHDIATIQNELQKGIRKYTGNRER